MVQNGVQKLAFADEIYFEKRIFVNIYTNQTKN
jgi:hypothetical protein